jgi:A/G-specific adenine glycosylase
LVGGAIPMKEKKEHIERRLLAWFRQTKRDLPWRRTYDPYHVWISEIMLQQTQMDRGVDYFRRWVARFPDVTAVAAAGEQEILKYWEGLGYYARARNLHRAARVMVEEHGGMIPCEYDDLLSLPGIGPYTAAAIASIACDQDMPAIDANVMRIFARLFDIDEPVKDLGCRQHIEQLAWELLPAGKARAFNQALMDLGRPGLHPEKSALRGLPACPVLPCLPAGNRGRSACAWQPPADDCH